MHVALWCTKCAWVGLALMPLSTYMCVDVGRMGLISVFIGQVSLLDLGTEFVLDDFVFAQRGVST